MLSGHTIEKSAFSLGVGFSWNFNLYYTAMQFMFPPDVWGGITDWLDPYSLATLLMTGDRRLANLLRQGVTSFELDLSHLKVTYPFSWPSDVLIRLPNILKMKLVLNQACALPVKMHLSSEQLSELPSRLCKLSLGFDDGLSGNRIAALPETLEQLSLYHNKTMTSQCLAQLPKYLLGLSLTSNRLIDGSGFANLPKGLRTLDLSSVETVSNGDLAFLPQGLTELSLPLVKRLTDACAEYLPPDLTHLHLSGDNITNEWFGQLPPSLHTLILRAATAPTNVAIQQLVERCPDIRILGLPKAALTIAALLSLPNELQQLDCTAFIELLEDKFVAALPRHLTTLDLRPNFRLTPSCLPLLPRSLKHIDWPQKFAFTSANGLSQLPPALKHLDLTRCKTVANETVAALPPALVALSLPQTNTLTDVGLKYLPRRLEALHLFANKEITARGFAALPGSLRSLTINGPGFSEDSVQYLPKSLTTLTIDAKAPISDDVVPHLPRALKMLRIANALITDDCIPDLPPQIKNLYLSTCDLHLDELKLAFPKINAVKL